MPHGSIEVLGSASGVRTVGQMPSDTGHIVQATARQWPIIGPGLQTWAEIWLLISEKGRGARVALLAQGYVYNNTSIAWSGRIPLEPGMHVQLHTYSSNQSTIRLHITTDVES